MSDIVKAPKLPIHKLIPDFLMKYFKKPILIPDKTQAF